MGCKRVPEPPAKTIPFLDLFTFCPQRLHLIGHKIHTAYRILNILIPLTFFAICPQISVAESRGARKIFLFAELRDSKANINLADWLSAVIRMLYIFVHQISADALY